MFFIYNRLIVNTIDIGICSISAPTRKPCKGPLRQHDFCSDSLRFTSVEILQNRVQSDAIRGFVCLFVFYVPSTARSFRDSTPIYCPMRSY